MCPLNICHALSYISKTGKAGEFKFGAQLCLDYISKTSKAREFKFVTELCLGPSHKADV